MRGETSAFQHPLAGHPKPGGTYVQQPEQPEPSGSVERISTDERTRAICDGSKRKRRCGLLANRRVEAGSKNRRLGQGRVKPHRAGWAVSHRGFDGVQRMPHTSKHATRRYHAKQSTASAAVCVLSLVRPPRRFCETWRARRMRNLRVQAASARAPASNPRSPMHSPRTARCGARVFVRGRIRSLGSVCPVPERHGFTSSIPLRL